jgi:GNAT superfamily N-acetyltransferase
VTGSVQERLERHGLAVPSGARLTSFAERPDLDSAFGAVSFGVWEPFMNEDPVANAAFTFAFDTFPELQLLLLDEAGSPVAAAHAMPLAWDGTDDGLPDGWDAQVLRSQADHAAGRPFDTLGAMLIVVKPGVRGGGLAGTMLGALRAAARAHGFGALIACVRPNEKERYPLVPIERYAFWARDDGLPLDPWIRLHIRLGGRIVRTSPESMTVRGTISEWETWTGLRFPDSGDYVVKQATAPVRIDVERDEGVYHDQNVWVVHALT